MPPPPKLRATSSMVGLDTMPNGNGLQHKNKLSQSSFFLNGKAPMNEDDQSMQSSSIKLKRKKWYSMFLPPKEVKIKKDNTDSKATKEGKEKKNKRQWFKGKKKRDKEQIAIQC